MCTAITFRNGDHYFGRNLDLEYSYSESVTVTPRNYPFQFRNGQTNDRHYAMIGMAYVCQDYPLYYDATNEKGLSIAGLNFPGNAFYPPVSGETNFVGTFELIPWLLCKCATVGEVRKELDGILISDTAFAPQLPPSPLHWIVADGKEAITVEAMREGVKVYDNPVGVLTNNPPFDYHLLHLTQYMNLTSNIADNRFSADLELNAFSKGMGSMGLPGGFSSPSRFVRAAFNKWNSRCEATENANVSQFFHLLGSVEFPKGSAQAHGDLYEITHYSSCCNTDKGVYYYRTYGNSQISAVDMYKENLDGQQLASYPLVTEQQIHFHN